jgi:hypothetical protein
LITFEAESNTLKTKEIIANTHYLCATIYNDEPCVFVKTMTNASSDQIYLYFKTTQPCEYCLDLLTEKLQNLISIQISSTRPKETTGIVDFWAAFCTRNSALYKDENPWRMAIV